MKQESLKKYAEEMGKTIKGFTPEAMGKLMKYPWPGNVRELENVVERTVVMIDDEMVREEHLILPGQKEKEQLPEHVPLTSEELRSAQHLYCLGSLGCVLIGGLWQFMCTTNQRL